MSRISFVILLAASATAVAADAPSFEILPAAQGKVVIKQCSRETVDSVSGYWLPTQEDILELEKRLPSYLNMAPSGKQAMPLNKSGRQYVGVVAGGKKYVYGNFYPLNMPLEKKGGEPVVVCDGGPAFWGVLYSVENKEFQGLHFNGGW